MSTIATPPPILRLAPLLGEGDACHFSTIGGSAIVSLPHGHDFCEIFWAIQGEGVEDRNGQARQLHPGSYGVVGPADVHAFGDGGGLVFRNLALPTVAWDRLRRRYGDDLADLFGRERPPERGLLAAEQLRLVEHVARPLRAGRRDALSLDRMLLAWEQVLAERPRDDLPDWLAEAVGLDETLRRGVAAWVKVCGYSHEHVSRACRRYLGCTPTDLVNAARVERACRLLEEGVLAVVPVALASGFGNVGHFHQTFRRLVGVTPASYRSQQRAALP